jgi:hypothetical protein
MKMRDMPGMFAEFHYINDPGQKFFIPLESVPIPNASRFGLQMMRIFQDSWSVYKLADQSPEKYPTARQIRMDILAKRMKRTLANPNTRVGRRAALRRAGFDPDTCKLNDVIMM